jgi:hypothetical protein
VLSLHFRKISLHFRICRERLVRIGLHPQPDSAVSGLNPRFVRKVATCPTVSPTLRSLCCAEWSASQQDGWISAGSLSTRISNLQKGVRIKLRLVRFCQRAVRKHPNVNGTRSQPQLVACRRSWRRVRFLSELEVEVRLSSAECKTKPPFLLGPGVGQGLRKSRYSEVRRCIAIDNGPNNPR